MPKQQALKHLRNSRTGAAQSANTHRSNAAPTGPAAGHPEHTPTSAHAKHNTTFLAATPHQAD